MTPVDMTVLHKPECGQFGDCFQCCIASLLELPAADVPHFMNYQWEEGDPDGGRWYPLLNGWLSARGFSYLEFAIPDDMEPPHWFKEIEQGGFNVYHILSGQSPRARHAVVARNGVIVHDPHPSRDGLIGPGKEGWQLGFLVKRCY